LTTQDLRKFYDSYIHQAGVVVSTVGSFDKSRWETEISEIIHRLPSGGAKLVQPDRLVPSRELSVVCETKQPLHQSQILVGFLGPDLKNEDRFALKLLHSCLAGQGGRLFLELRDRQSLAYSVAPLQSDNLETGMFGVYIGCSPEKLPVAIHGIRKELERTVENAMSQKELSRAKQYLLGRIALDMQRFSSQAMMFGLDEMYGLGFDFSLKLADKIKSVSAEDIRRIAEKYLILDKAVLSIVHNQEMEEAFIRHAWEGKNSTLSQPKVRKSF
jgi:zinc protease